MQMHAFKCKYTHSWDKPNGTRMQLALETHDFLFVSLTLGVGEAHTSLEVMPMLSNPSRISCAHTRACAAQTRIQTRTCATCTLYPATVVLRISLRSHLLSRYCGNWHHPTVVLAINLPSNNTHTRTYAAHTRSCARKRQENAYLL